MFNDIRSKKVVFIAHCLLNQNSISDGTAVAPAAVKEVIDFFLDRDIGIVQMPCPEMNCLGLDRGNIYGADSPVVVENTRIRNEMKMPDRDELMNSLTCHVVNQIVEYKSYGFEVAGIVGANRSPSCGVDTTSDNNEELCGQGLFIEKIAKWLKENGIETPMIGIKTCENITEKLERFMTD